MPRILSLRAVRWIGWVPVVLFVKDFGLVPKYVTGHSMQPTLNPDSSRLRRDIAVFDRSFWFAGRTFRRGNIVAIRSPVSPDDTLIKRIIALEGDEVETLPPYPEITVTVPEGQIWVEGDERFHSEDSNYFGPVPLGLVDSKLLFLVWPLDRFGWPWAEEKHHVTHQRWREGRVQIVSKPSQLSCQRTVVTHELI